MTRMLERIAPAKLLGFIFQDNFEIDMRVNFVLRRCNQRLYSTYLNCCAPLSLIVSQGLIVPGLRYAFRAWSGFFSANEYNRIYRLLLNGFTGLVISLLFSRYPSMILWNPARLTSSTIWGNRTTDCMNCCPPMLSILIVYAHVGMILFYLYVPLICISHRL